MATGPRVTLQPIPLSLTSGGATWLTSTSAGYDTGTGTITAWTGQLGVMIPLTAKNVILAYACGATAASVTQTLVGALVGSTGQVLPATTEQFTIAANTSGWLGPWDVPTFAQVNPTGVTYSGAINTTPLTSAAQGCVVIDLTTTTTLALRAYGLY
jgi:hypothetical protein